MKGKGADALETRVLIRGTALFVLGLLILSFGALQLVEDRAVRNARLEYLRGKSFDAAKDLKRVVDLPFVDPRVHYNIGIAQNDVFDYDNALGEFRKLTITSSDPRMQAEGYYMLAWTLLLRLYKRKYTEGNPIGNALTYLTEALRLNPDHKGAKNLYERIMHLLNNQPPRQQEDKLKPDPNQRFSPGYEEPKP
jgi:tetratricopeptide (TPR) repeat protein